MHGDVALARKADRIVGVLPYFVKKSKGVRMIQMPPLCRFMGPYIVEDLFFGKHVFQLCETLIEGLPDFDVFEQCFHYQVDNWLPFHWHNFKQQNLYSYKLGDIDDLEKVYLDFAPDYRNNKLKKASELVEVKHGLPVEEILSGTQHEL